MRYLPLLLLLVFASFSFAYTATDYLKLNYTDVNLNTGIACTYYTVSNPSTASLSPTLSDKLGIDRWTYLEGSVKSSWWEYLRLNVPYVYEEVNETCAEKEAEKDCMINVTIYQNEWAPLDTSQLSLSAKETRQVRFCGQLQTVINKDGFQEIAVDHVPKFAGYVYDGTIQKDGLKSPDYEWWQATGGTITNFTNGTGTYYVHKFTANGTFVTDTGITAQVLVVAGGGGSNGGITYGETGGGGAGGVLYNGSFTIPAGSYSVVVGNGGVANINGQNSSFSTMGAGGGGAGGHHAGDGVAGGSGGGGGSSTSGTQTGGNGLAGQGNNGGNGYGSSTIANRASGGGGGASGVGGNAASGSGGNGGVGVTYNITGSNVCYAGGGAGSDDNHASCGSQSCGGGACNNNATANTGGGGGGSSETDQGGYSGRGGSGIVIITYQSWETNHAPYVVSVNTTPENPSDENNLNCSFQIDDEDGDPLDITGYWFKDGDMQTDLNFTLNDVTEGTVNWSTISDALTSTGEDWDCAVNATDGSLNSALNYSDNVTIANGLVVEVSAASTYETENSSILITLTPIATVSSYNISVAYNNTIVLTATISGNGSDPKYYTAYAIAPLVAVNTTNIPYEVNVSAVINGDLAESSDSDDHVVKTWYNSITDYPMTAAVSYTVEDQNNVSVTVPDHPPLANTDVSYTPMYGFSNCTVYYANGTATNTTTCNTTISVISILNYSIPASHKSASGLIYQDYYVNRSYALSFSQTSESTSSKSFSDTDTNMSREYFVWLTNRTNGTINGASDMSTVFNVTFYSESTLEQLSVNTTSAVYTITFPDDETKEFSISYNGTVQNSTVRAYPNFYNATISSIEQYTKIGYTTRMRITSLLPTNLSEQQNISVYLPVNTSTSYAIINVVDNGDEVVNAVVRILKYHSTLGEYIIIDEKVTNSEGRTFTYIDSSAYYKFQIVENGEEVYFSAGPEQFICDPTCEITINVQDSITLSLIGPHAYATCYGVNATNSINFIYSDPTGLTSSINFLAYRQNQATPVCNYTVAASASSYSCSLQGGENLSQYLYSCEVWRSASPSALAFVDLIDFRLYEAIVDWIMPALILVTTLGVSAAYLPLGIGLGSIALFVMSIMGIIAIPVTTSMPIMIVGLVIAFFLSKRGAD